MHELEGEVKNCPTRKKVNSVVEHQMSKMRSALPSEDQPFKDLTHRSPGVSSDAPKDSARRTEDFKTVILRELQENSDPKEVAAVLRLDRYKLPVLIQSRENTQFTLLRSEFIFQLSGLKQDGYLEDLHDLDDLEELEQKSSRESNTWSNITFDIESPYWRLYRNDYEGDRYFVAPKTKDQRLTGKGKEEEMWIRKDDAGDQFLAMGWLVEDKVDDAHGAQTTRYVCALNISTNPISMWLIYDYRLPDDDNHLHTSSVPTMADQNFYLSPIDDSQVTSNTTTAPAVTTGKKGLHKDVNNGYMGQPEPWDIACLYPDATRQWPGHSSNVDVHAKDPATLTPYGDPDTTLRAKRME